jgi:dolichol-phosphate mannosyltransferase
MKVLTAIPVYNEEKYLHQVLTEVRRHSEELLVVNDGSSDGTGAWLAGQPDLHQIIHPRNRGYGAAIRSAMGYALAHQYDVLVTMDCDGQHEPARIPVLLEALGADVDVVSGSRYLRTFRQNTVPPRDRQRINHQITRELNDRFGLHLTDAFCGFKAYRVSALARLHLSENGWGMPLQLWVQAAQLGFRIREVAVPRLYLDPDRAFGGVMDNPAQRLAYYHEVIARESARCWEQAPGSCR